MILHCWEIRLLQSWVGLAALPGVLQASLAMQGAARPLRVADNRYVPVSHTGRIETAVVAHTPSGEEVQLNEPVGDGYEVEQVGYDRYLAKLVPFDPDNIKKGKFEGMVVYTVSYL